MSDQLSERELEIFKRRFGGEDATRIPSPDPNFKYRFIRTDYANHPNVEKQRARGWEPITSGEEIKKLGLKPNADNTYGLPPDTILAKMPRRLYEAISRETAAENRRRQAFARDLPKQKIQEISDQLGIKEDVFEGGDTPLKKK